VGWDLTWQEPQQACGYHLQTSAAEHSSACHSVSFTVQIANEMGLQELLIGSRPLIAINITTTGKARCDSDLSDADVIQLPLPRVRSQRTWKLEGMGNEIGL
jgi:hypothetical protein